MNTTMQNETMAQKARTIGERVGAASAQIAIANGTILALRDATRRDPRDEPLASAIRHLDLDLQGEAKVIEALALAGADCGDALLVDAAMREATAAYRAAILEAARYGNALVRYEAPDGERTEEEAWGGAPTRAAAEAHVGAIIDWCDAGSLAGTARVVGLKIEPHYGDARARLTYRVEPIR